MTFTSDLKRDPTVRRGYELRDPPVNPNLNLGREGSSRHREKEREGDVGRGDSRVSFTFSYHTPVCADRSVFCDVLEGRQTGPRPRPRTGTGRRQIQTSRP